MPSPARHQQIRWARVHARRAYPPLRSEHTLRNRSGPGNGCRQTFASCLTVSNMLRSLRRMYLLATISMPYHMGRRPGCKQWIAAEPRAWQEQELLCTGRCGVPVDRVAAEAHCGGMHGKCPAPVSTNQRQSAPRCVPWHLPQLVQLDVAFVAHVPGKPGPPCIANIRRPATR